MAVTTNQIIKRQGRDGNIAAVGIAATKKIPEGTLAYLDAGGDASDVINTNVGKFVGIARNEYDNTSGADGDIVGEFYTDGTFPLVSSGLTNADIGATVYGVDNYTVNKTATDQPEVGIIRDVLSATLALVEIKGIGNGLMTAGT